MLGLVILGDTTPASAQEWRQYRDNRETYEDDYIYSDEDGYPDDDRYDRGNERYRYDPYREEYVPRARRREQFRNRYRNERPAIFRRTPTILDLSISAKFQSRDCAPGYLCSLAIRIRNDGPRPYIGPLRIQNKLLTNTKLRVDKSDLAGWSCNQNGATTNCLLLPGRFEPGRTILLQLDYKVPAEGLSRTLKSCASIQWSLYGGGEPSVAGIQSALAARGYNPGPIDGSPGRKTRQAIKRFQRDNGLRSSGFPSDNTIKRLFRNQMSVDGDLDRTNDRSCATAKAVAPALPTETAQPTPPEKPAKPRKPAEAPQPVAPAQSAEPAPTTPSPAIVADEFNRRFGDNDQEKRKQVAPPRDGATGEGGQQDDTPSRKQPRDDTTRKAPRIENAQPKPKPRDDAKPTAPKPVVTETQKKPQDEKPQQNPIKAAPSTDGKSHRKAVSDFHRKRSSQAHEKATSELTETVPDTPKQSTKPAEPAVAVPPSKVRPKSEVPPKSKPEPKAEPKAAVEPESAPKPEAEPEHVKWKSQLHEKYSSSQHDKKTTKRTDIHDKARSKFHDKYKSVQHDKDTSKLNKEHTKSISSAVHSKARSSVSR